MLTLPSKIEGRDEGKDEGSPMEFVNNTTTKETKERMESKNNTKESYKMAKERETEGKRGKGERVSLADKATKREEVNKAGIPSPVWNGRSKEKGGGIA